MLSKKISFALVLCCGVLGAARLFAQAEPAVTPPAPTQAATQTPAATNTATLTDAQIAGIVMAVNKGEIDESKLAQKSAKSKDVKAFAKQMVDEHSKVNKELTALASKKDIKPDDSEVKKEMTTMAQESLAKVRKLKGTEFDKAYVDDAVVMHQTVLDSIDSKLLPSATDADLKAFLTKVRESVAAHLEHAKRLQTSMTAGR